MSKEVSNNTQVHIPAKELEIQDEFSSDGDEVGEDIPEEHSNRARELTKGINFSNKGMLIALLVVGALIVYFFFGGKLGLPSLPSFGSEEDAEQGTASEIVSGESGDADDAVSYIISDLSEYYPGYDITRDDEAQTVTALGELEGQPHKLVLNFDGEYLEETLGDSKLTDEGQPVEEEAVTEKGDDNVTIPISEFNKSSLSQPKQEYVESNPDDVSEINTYGERVIVQYEKLPVLGTNLTIYSKVIETGEVIIFNVTLAQYSKLEKEGTTVLHLTRSEGNNIKVIDSVNLVNWQD